MLSQEVHGEHQLWTSKVRNTRLCPENFFLLLCLSRLPWPQSLIQIVLVPKQVKYQHKCILQLTQEVNLDHRQDIISYLHPRIPCAGHREGCHGIKDLNTPITAYNLVECMTATGAAKPPSKSAPGRIWCKGCMSIKQPAIQQPGNSFCRRFDALFNSGPPVHNNLPQGI